MFEFKREGNVVVCRINTDLPFDEKTTTNLHFTHETNRAYLAELIYRYLENRYKEAIRSLTKKAYERGWNDHRQKKRKRQHFDCDLLQRYSDL